MRNLLSLPAVSFLQIKVVAAGGLLVCPWTKVCPLTERVTTQLLKQQKHCDRYSTFSSAVSSPVEIYVLQCTNFMGFSFLQEHRGEAKRLLSFFLIFVIMPILSLWPLPCSTCGKVDKNPESGIGQRQTRLFTRYT